MKRSPPRSIPRGPYDVPKAFWLVRLVTSLVLILVSYLVGVFTYLVIIRLSELPHGRLWDDAFRPFLAFVLIVAASIVMLIPYLHKSWDKGTRMFSILSTLFLLAFASLSTSHIVDPALPLRFISTYAIEPLRRLLQF